MNHDLPKVWLNGEADKKISVFDRGLMYGQSVFETISVFARKPLLLDAHLKRLQEGCTALGIPYDAEFLVSEIVIACASLPKQARAVLRINVTMGEGGRGYENPQNPKANRIVSLHEYPDYPSSYWQQGVTIGLVAMRLSEQPLLAGLKHANRLEQTLARSQWHDDWQEALILNENEKVIEATQSNVFVVKDGVIKTPNLSKAGVAGVMRDFILSKVNSLGSKAHITELTMSDIYNADEVFLSNSVIGLWPVSQCLKQHFSDHSMTRKLQTICQDYELIPDF